MGRYDLEPFYATCREASGIFDGCLAAWEEDPVVVTHSSSRVAYMHAVVVDGRPWLSHYLEISGDRSPLERLIVQRACMEQYQRMLTNDRRYIDGTQQIKLYTDKPWLDLFFHWRNPDLRCFGDRQVDLARRPELLPQLDFLRDCLVNVSHVVGETIAAVRPTGTRSKWLLKKWRELGVNESVSHRRVVEWYLLQSHPDYDLTRPLPHFASDPVWGFLSTYATKTDPTKTVSPWRLRESAKYHE